MISDRQKIRSHAAIAMSTIVAAAESETGEK